MQVRFLLGPAGSGKTFRCLAEVRAALKNPEGAPLVILAPKQATFQLERQLLDHNDLAGFTRLQILSFDRLAQFVFEQLRTAPPRLLSGEGRLMVLRAMLHRHADELKLFSRSAKRGGFARELGALLAELQQHQFGPAKLRALADNEKFGRELRGKLHDLAVLSERYEAWLREHQLQDAHCLLDLAASTLRQEASAPTASLTIENLWLDGFAEMTPQELALLAAIMPFCKKATLAFCLETEPTKTESWLSIWSAIGKTFQNCRLQIAALPGCKVLTEVLARTPGKNRFIPGSDLAVLEESWTLSSDPRRAPAEPDQAPAELTDETGKPSSSIRLTACANPEAEAVNAAREILRFVRSGNRFRDCAVLVRNLETHHQAIARVFRRYEIPFFLDRREGVAHHPLAELTRNSLRLAAFDWKAADFFAALKCGFVPAGGEEIDELENRALEFGWRGKQWLSALPEENAERIRQKIIAPFEQFQRALQRLNFQPSGAALAQIIRDLWRELDAEKVLEQWADEEDFQAARAARVTHHGASPHATVWQQMNLWLDNLALAFPHETLRLADWLPVLEAGLGNLSVGVIPPALDEVLVGAIDRARNPDLKFALLLGVNESVFPAPPGIPVILTNTDRAELDAQAVALGGNPLDQISRERYLGYIACTRANEGLLLSFSRQSMDGHTLNPSPFVAQMKKIFPGLEVQEFSESFEWSAAEHANELVPLLVETTPAAQTVERLHDLSSAKSLVAIPALKSLAENLTAMREPLPTENVSPEMAAQIYGPVLNTSVSRLEEFAACPFKFFVRSGLRANERKVFELDARERGNFQHEVLKEFHNELRSEGKRWRDLTPEAARERIRTIAAKQAESHRQGLLRDSAATVFAADAMTAALEDFVGIIVSWMRSQYEFDPVAAELGFGGKDDTLPAWEVKLADGRKLSLNGRIDRVDIWRDPAGDTLLAVVTDYKSSEKKLEPWRMENGLQLQLLAYLGALRGWSAQGGQSPNIVAHKTGASLMPVGAFYVSLRGKFENGDSREEVLEQQMAKSNAYRHSGRFDAGHLRKFDRREVSEGDQFKFKLNKKDNLPSKHSECLAREEFTALIDDVEGQLRRLGEEIFSGVTAVAPYRKGKEIPCERCDYRAACRIDEWTHEFRDLKSSAATGSAVETVSD